MRHQWRASVSNGKPKSSDQGKTPTQDGGRARVGNSGGTYSNDRERNQKIDTVFRAPSPPPKPPKGESK